MLRQIFPNHLRAQGTAITSYVLPAMCLRELLSQQPGGTQGAQRSHRTIAYCIHCSAACWISNFLIAQVTPKAFAAVGWYVPAERRFDDCCTLAEMIFSAVGSPGAITSYSAL